MKAKFGRYVFLKKLAVGGMAEIFLARRLSFGGFAKFVVLKRLLPEHRGKRAYEQLFLTEARIHAVLNHPHIVSLHDLGKLDDAYFMAMEYVHGVSGAELMARAAQKQKPIPLGSALHIAIAMAEALHFGHTTLDDLGEDPMLILHHDVSPHNIQIGYDGETKLLDYGVATRIGHPAPGGRRGKPAYMSPEAINKGELDHRSDLFSLAIVLYEMSLGRRLFKAPTAKETMARARVAQVKPPSEIDPNYPRELEAVVLKALSREPDERYPDGRTFATTLKRVGEKLGLDMSQSAFSAWLGELFRDEIARRQAELAALARASTQTRQGGEGGDGEDEESGEHETARPDPPRPPRPATGSMAAARLATARRRRAATGAAADAWARLATGPLGGDDGPAATEVMAAVRPAAPAASDEVPDAPDAQEAARTVEQRAVKPAVDDTADEIPGLLDGDAEAGDSEPEDSEMATIVKAPAEFDLPSRPPTPAPVEPSRTPTPTPVPDMADVGDAELDLDEDRSSGAGEYEGEDALAYELPPEARDAAAEWDESTYALPLAAARRRTALVAVLGIALAVGAFFAGQRLDGVLGLRRGSVVVDSEPAGAEVVVNGKPAGKTPLSISDLQVGDELRLEVGRAGYAPAERKLTIYPDRLDREWTVTLQPLR
ncbi:MAG: serine/threonine protein kinase [Myxococcales bacterium]|nr:serine/threonine protein kinase [Myxococcales bacterium]